MATDAVLRQEKPIPDAFQVSAISSDDSVNLPPPITGVPLTISQSPFRDSHNNEGMYKQNLLDPEYVRDTGMRVQPVTGPDADGVVRNVRTQLHNGTMHKIVKWTIERENAKPVAPHTDTQDPNEVLVRTNISVANPLLKASSIVWRLSGVYVYQLLIPKTLERGSTYPTGASAAEVRVSSDNFFDAGDFSKDLLDCRFALEEDAKPLGEPDLGDTNGSGAAPSRENPTAPEQPRLGIPIRTA